MELNPSPSPMKAAIDIDCLTRALQEGDDWHPRFRRGLPNVLVGACLNWYGIDNDDGADVMYRQLAP